MKYLIILFLFLAPIGVFSTNHHLTIPEYQLNNGDSLAIWEKLNIQCESKINDLLRQQAEQCKRSGTINGFRLQIYFGSGANSHNQAVKMKTEFLSSYPEVKTYLLFKSPDFIVRVGNFRTKSEALKMQKSLLYKFPNAFIVADEIALPELLNFTTIN
ncbi:MAG: SPOR domain-containing protein [Mariniphaga sp.]